MLSVVPGASGLVDTLTGQSVVLSVTGGVVYGKNTNGDEVFRITRRCSGNVTLNQSRAVVHADRGERMTSRSRSAAIWSSSPPRSTDGDGDTDSETVDIGNKFVFEDDGPIVLGATVMAW